MKLLNELISISRVDDEPHQEDQTPEEGNLDHIEFDDDDGDELGLCSDCLCDPCICDKDPEQETDGDLGDDEYAPPADEFDSYGAIEPHDKYEDQEEGMSALDRGYADCEAGKGREANPYPRGSQEHLDWDAAWADANDQLGGDVGAGDEQSVADMEREHDMTDVEADADTLANIGWGTDEDYGKYEDNEERGMKEECPACYGTGRDYDETCVRCGGRGYLISGRYDDESGDEDEEPGRQDPGAYGQLGAHMGGAKETDTMDTDVNPEAADELDLGDETGDNGGIEGDQEGEAGDQKLDALAGKASEDPDRQGVIRTVNNAHLVYKRQIEDGTYEELWIYNIGNMRDELDVRKAILAGTDIPTSKTASPDGTQKYELWSAGNAEILQIQGLPN